MHPTPMPYRARMAYDSARRIVAMALEEAPSSASINRSIRLRPHFAIAIYEVGKKAKSGSDQKRAITRIIGAEIGYRGIPQYLAATGDPSVVCML